MPGTNSMQANSGLGVPGMSASGILTPAEAAIRMNEQAVVRQSQTSQILQGTTMGMPSAASFSAQFQQEMQRIQQQQLSPYAAQAMAQMMPSQSQFQQGMMPSPIMMTPPSTGNFRPPMSSYGNTAAISPMQAMPAMSGISPFSPQRPSPQFMSPRDQRMQEQDINSTQSFAMMSQVPRVAGQAIGLGAGAALGAGMGARFGAVGAVAGAVGGAALAGFSGVARGMGDLAQMPMQPAIQRRQMGAALQRTTSNFVVSGSDLHAKGSGLSQSAAIDLAGGFQDMSSDKGFQQQTGAMFNAQDLMKITDKGGQAGLLDTAQSVPQIKKQVRDTAETIKQFMQITNDPDITNVIRQMGNMRQMGMTQQDMVQAAQGMKTYSRMAGTSINGIQQMGGAPGAMTFSQAGMTAATGFNYGNYAAASARQQVASGGMSSRELALMGGVQGITQRDIQTQAASVAMPLYAASNSQWSGSGSNGQWGLNSSRVGQPQSAFDMVHGALGAARSGVQQGGLSALAMMPAQQREISDLAMRSMSPEQAKAQRFGGVQKTAEMLGQRGTTGFGLAAQIMYGKDAGEQMWRQAKDPKYWAAERAQIKRRKKDLALDQAAERKAGRGTLEKVGDFVGLGGLGRDLGQGWDDIDIDIMGGRDVSGTISRGLDSVGDSISGTVSDMFLDDDIVRRHVPKSAAIDSAAEREGQRKYSQRKGEGKDYGFLLDPIKAELKKENESAGIGAGSWGNLGRAMNYDSGMEGISGTAATIGGGVFNTALSVATKLPGDYGGEGVAEGAQGLVELLGGGGQAAREKIRGADVERTKVMQIIKGSKQISEKDDDEVYKIIDKLTGGKDTAKTVAGMGVGAANKMEDEGRTSWWSSVASGNFGAAGKDLTRGELEQNFLDENKNITKEKFNTLSAAEKTKLMKYHTAKTRENSEDVDDMLNTTERKGSIEIAENVDDAAEATADKFESRRDTLEKKLGMKEKFLGFDVDKDGVEDFRKAIQGDQSVEQTMLIAAVAGGGDSGKDKYDEAYKLWKKANPKGKEKEFLAEWQKAKKKFKGLGDDQQELYKGMTEGQGTLEDVATIATEQKEQTSSEAMRSFASELEDYADPDAMTKVTHGIDTISGQDLANAISDEGLVKMANEEGGMEKAVVYRQAQTGNKRAAAQVEAWAAESADEGTTSDDAAVSAEGKEAQELEGAGKAMENMAAMFADMKPAAKDFREASKDFLEAVKTDAFIERVED